MTPETQENAFLGSLGANIALKGLKNRLENKPVNKPQAKPIEPVHAAAATNTIDHPFTKLPPSQVAVEPELQPLTELTESVNGEFHDEKPSWIKKVKS